MKLPENVMVTMRKLTLLLTAFLLTIISFAQRNGFNDSNDAYYMAQQYTYDEEGNLAQTLALNNKGQKIYAYLYDYDKEKNTKTQYLLNKAGR